MDIIGHRGARGEAPENTISGFKYLRSLGIRRIEFDIQVAGDGQLIVIHDDTLTRTTNSSGHIKDKTVAELAAVDACHQSFSLWPDSDGVPTLADSLAVLHDFDHLQLEVKAQTQADCERIAELLPSLWQPFGAKAITTSFNLDYLRLIKSTQPQIPRGLLVTADCQSDIVALALELDCVLIAPHHSLCHGQLVQTAHAAGLHVSTWTVNDAARMLALRAMGVDSMITDYPTQAMQVLG